MGNTLFGKVNYSKPRGTETRLDEDQTMTKTNNTNKVADIRLKENLNRGMAL